MKKDLLIIILVVLLAACVGVGSFYIFKSLDDKPVNGNENTPKPNQENQGSSSSVTVVDSLNDNKTIGSYNYKLIIPKITIETENAKTLNQKMLNEMKNSYDKAISAYSTSSSNNDSMISFNKGLTISYNYLIKNNVASIYVFTEVPEGGNGFRNGDQPINKNYFYDIKNDKQLTLSQATKLMGITDIDTAPNYESLDNGCSKMIIKDNSVKIKYFDKCI